MKPTDLNYESTINVGWIKTDALETMMTDMIKKNKKLELEMDLVDDELRRREDL